MNPEHRVTQQDVANIVGVNRSTVSLALKNHPSIPEATRQKIREAAAELGYTPDPMLSSLAAYRTRGNPQTYHGTLAWLVNNIPPFQWDECGMFLQNYLGAKNRAAIYGYSLETFDLQALQMSQARLAGVLRSRNISGILLCPQPRPNTRLDFPFEYFSSVTIGYSLRSPRLHTVSPSQFRAMVLTMQELYKLGYQRIGFAYMSDTDERVGHNFLAGYLVESHINAPHVRIPPEDAKKLDPARLKKWVSKYKIDAIVVESPVLKMVKAAGIRCPEDLGVASASLSPDNKHELAGVMESSYHAGEVAVDFIVAQIQQGFRGIPDQARQIHIEGKWVPGPSLRQVGESKLREIVDFTGITEHA